MGVLNSTNIAAGIITKLVNFLRSESIVAEQSVFALANIAGDGAVNIATSIFSKTTAQLEMVNIFKVRSKITVYSRLFIC